MASQAKLATLEEQGACFEDVDDPRSEINRKHPLVSVVAISMMVVLAGADGPTSIHRWAKSLEEQLPSLLDLPNGIPSRDVIRRVRSVFRGCLPCLPGTQHFVGNVNIDFLVEATVSYRRIRRTCRVSFGDTALCLLGECLPCVSSGDTALCR